MGRAYAMYASRGRLTMEERTDGWMDGWMPILIEGLFLKKKQITGETIFQKYLNNTFAPPNILR